MDWILQKLLLEEIVGNLPEWIRSMLSMKWVIMKVNEIREGEGNEKAEEGRFLDIRVILR